VGARHDQLDVGRRNRILMGNLQWTQSILWKNFRRNPVAGLVALRRVFRMFWAYWLVCLALGLAMLLNISIVPVVLMLGVFAVLSGSVRQLVGAAWISLLAPLRMVRPHGPWGAAWK
jgi:hypothetical protein